MNTHTHTQNTWTQPVPHESPQCPFQLPAKGTNCPDLWDFDAFVLLVNGIMSSFVGSSFHSTFCLWDPVTLLPVVVHYLSSRLVIPHCVTTPQFISSILLLFFFFLVLPVYCYQPISLHSRAHMLSHVIPWTSARQTPLSMDFSRQEHWSGLSFPSPSVLLLMDIWIASRFCPLQIVCYEYSSLVCVFWWTCWIYTQRQNF